MINEDVFPCSSCLYRNSFINDNVNHSNIFLACRKKKLKTEKPIKKNLRLFHQKTAFQNECHAKELHDILTTLSFRCCKVVSFFFSTFSAGFFVWQFSFNHEQHCYETALVPLRRVKYYKHVKSDLCYNITWRNRPTELAGEQQLTRWMFNSNRDYRTYLSPLQLNGTCGISRSESTFFLSTIETLSSIWAWK